MGAPATSDEHAKRRSVDLQKQETFQGVNVFCGRVSAAGSPIASQNEEVQRYYVQNPWQRSI